MRMTAEAVDRILNAELRIGNLHLRDVLKDKAYFGDVALVVHKTEDRELGFALKGSVTISIMRGGKECLVFDACKWSPETSLFKELDIMEMARRFMVSLVAKGVNAESLRGRSSNTQMPAKTEFYPDDEPNEEP